MFPRTVFYVQVKTEEAGLQCQLVSLSWSCQRKGWCGKPAELLNFCFPLVLGDLGLNCFSLNVMDSAKDTKISIGKRVYLSINFIMCSDFTSQSSLNSNNLFPCGYFKKSISASQPCSLSFYIHKNSPFSRAFCGQPWKIIL